MITRAAQTHQAGHMRPAGRVFETPALSVHLHFYLQNVWFKPKNILCLKEIKLLVLLYTGLNWICLILCLVFFNSVFLNCRDASQCGDLKAFLHEPEIVLKLLKFTKKISFTAKNF